MHSFTVRVLGRAIAVDGDPATVPPEVAAQLRRLWEPCLTGAAPSERVWVTLDEQSPVPDTHHFFVRGSDPRVVANRLSDVVVGTAMSSLVPPEARERPLAQPPAVVGVHAAAVVRDGRAVLLVGGSHREELMRALAPTFDYLSDAAVAVDLDNGTVIGAAKPLTSHPEPELVSRQELPLAEVGLRPELGPVPLAAIVFLTPGASDQDGWEPLPIPVATARLAPAVPIMPALPQPMQDLARVVALTSGAVSMHATDPSAVPGLLDQVLAVGTTADLVIPIEPGPGPDTTPRPGEIRRQRMADGISDGSSLAFWTTEHKAVAVAGIAPYLWDAARQWIGLDEVTERVVEAVGVPEGADPRALVDQTVTALVAEKVLVRLD